MSDSETAASGTVAKPIRILGSLYMEIAILAFCGAIVSATGQTRGPVFDVVGPDFLPTVVALLVAALTLVQVVMHVARRWRSQPGGRSEVAAALGSALIFSAVTVAYVALLAFRMAPFFLLTAVFVMLTTLLLSPRFSWREAAMGLIIGLVLGVGLQYVFTQVLIIDLPT